jgi:hypothetical protein
MKLHTNRIVILSRADSEESLTVSAHLGAGNGQRCFAPLNMTV